jgi:hypothetical protein
VISTTRLLASNNQWIHHRTGARTRVRWSGSQRTLEGNVCVFITAVHIIKLFAWGATGSRRASAKAMRREVDMGATFKVCRAVIDRLFSYFLVFIFLRNALSNLSKVRRLVIDQYFSPLYSDSLQSCSTRQLANLFFPFLSFIAARLFPLLANLPVS